jgi:hypothetical protein
MMMESVFPVDVLKAETLDTCEANFLGMLTIFFSIALELAVTERLVCIIFLVA